jgi:hypothetical protein
VVRFVAAIAGIMLLGYFTSNRFYDRFGSTSFVFHSDDIYELPWCDRFGWVSMTGQNCILLSRGSIPLPMSGKCPGSFDIWIYNKHKPPVCVKRA